MTMQLSIPSGGWDGSAPVPATPALAPADGWLQEVRSAGERNPGRRFMVYLTDRKHFHDIPISFCFAVNGKVIE